MALTAWCFHLYRETVYGRTGKDSKAELIEFLERLDDGAAEGGASGVLSAVLGSWVAWDRNNLEKSVPRNDSVILRHLTLFVTPVSARTLSNCPDVCRIADKNTTALRAVTATLERLSARGLLQKFNKNKYQDVTYVMHDQIREHYARSMGLFVPDGAERNHYQASLYCTQPRDLPTPSMEHFTWVRDIVMHQIDVCRQIVGEYYSKNDPRPVQIETISRELRLARAVAQSLQATYGILRGGFSIAVLARLPFTEEDVEQKKPFGEFRNWLRRLINAANGLDEMIDKIDRKIEKRLENSGIKNGEQAKLREKRQTLSYLRPLFMEEIAWLLNERGLVSFVQGRTYDAVQHFHRAHQLVRHTRDASVQESAYFAMERRIRLNWIAAQIDRGNIVKARDEAVSILDHTAEFDWSTRSVTNLYARGYLALSDHLSGAVDPAKKNYLSVIDGCNEQGNMRGVAIFRRHLSDLYASQERLDDAREQINLAVAAAARSEQQDVLHGCLLTLASLLGRGGNPRGALERLDQVDTYGRRAGILKLQADVLRMRAEIMFQQGETDQSAALVARSIAICNRHGIRLRKLHALILYAEIIQSEGQDEHARNLLIEARLKCERLGYNTKGARAHRLLNRFAHERRGQTGSLLSDAARTTGSAWS